MRILAEWNLGVGGLDATADLRGGRSEYAPNSLNLMPDGQNGSRPFRNLLLIGQGARQLVSLKDSWGGLDDDDDVPARGSLFSTIGDMLVFCGQGRVHVEDADTGVLASNILMFLLKWEGVYDHAMSGPFTAGLPEPLPVEIGIIDNPDFYGLPRLTGTGSIKVARLRSITGDRSRASATSAILTLTDQAVYAVMPAAVSGQDRHVVFGTNMLLGGIGLHYRMPRANPFTNAEYRESDVERNVTITSVTGGDLLNAATGTFTAGDIGKLVEGVSGLTVPADTVVTEIVGGGQIRVSNAVTGTSGVVTLVSYVNGIRRAVPLNWKVSDLIEDDAWIYDFPPPTCSHAAQIEDRIVLAAYADASARSAASGSSPDASASADTPGTALLASLPGHFGSYDPRFPLYIPEAVVDFMGDGMDSYKFIGGRNGIYAVQYLNIQNGAPMTLTVLMRGEGIKHPHNWCPRERAIYLYTGRPIRIVEGGNIDTTFAAPVRREMQDISQDDMVVVGHPRGGGVIYAAGDRAWYYDEVTNRWSTELALGQSGFVGNVVSAVATQSKAIITLEEDGERTAYEFDAGQGNFVVGISHYQGDPEPLQPKVIQRLLASGEQEYNNNSIVWVGLHRNTERTMLRGVDIAEGSKHLYVPSAATLDAGLIRSFVLIYNSSVGSWELARIVGVESGTTPSPYWRYVLATPTRKLSDAADHAQNDAVVNGIALVAFRVYPVKIDKEGTFVVDSGEIEVPGCFSYAMSLVIPTSGKKAQPLDMELRGMVNEERVWQRTSTTFGKTS